MDGAHPNPFQGGTIGSGLVSVPPTILGIPSTVPIGPDPSGTFATHILLLVLYPLVVALLQLPWFIPYHYSCMGEMALPLPF